MLLLFTQKGGDSAVDQKYIYFSACIIRWSCETSVPISKIAFLSVI